MNVDAYRNRQGKLWLNIGSSTQCLEDFVNLDNSIFLWLVPYYPVLRWVLPAEKKSVIERYREARMRTKVLRHDCRKPLPFPDGSVDHILPVSFGGSSELSNLRWACRTCNCARQAKCA